MSEVMGVVQKTSETQSPPNSARKWTKKAFLINDVWYGAFINSDNKDMASSINEGDAVKVAFETKGDYNNWTGISLVERKEPTVTKDSPKADSMKPYNPSDKDFRITYLACRRDAIEFVKTGIQLEIFSLGTKKADKEAIFYDLVNTYAMLFTMKSWNIVPDNTVLLDEVKSEEPTKKAVNE